MFGIKITSNANYDRKEAQITKIREFKGKSVNEHINDYCVVDLETTGIFVGSSEIIEISAIRVRDNQALEEFSTLVNPQCHIPEEATAVNHITDDMVRNAPVLEDVIDAFLEFVGNDVILGYNNAGFDMNIIYDSVHDLRNKAFDNNYLDLLHAVRRSFSELENSKLETVSKHYELDTIGEHRALKDCYLTKAVYDKVYEEFGDSAFKKRGYASSRKSVQYTAETLALQQMSKLLEGMLSDDQITRDEVDELRYWIEEHRDLSGNYPFDKAFEALDKVLEDGQITEQELVDLKIIFEKIVDPVKALGCHDEIRNLTGKHVVLTGEFDYGDRSEVAMLIEAVGGINDKGVTKKTDYVVVGSQGSDAWKIGNYGGKIQKAMQWNAKGLNIKIVEEKDFIPATEYILNHPDECGCKE